MHDKPLSAIAAITTRHATRTYSHEPVPREVLETIIDAARRAPSANNVQPWDFVVVTNPETRKQIAELAEYGKFIADAPACVAVFCKDVKYFLEDGSAATENILVAAAALGVQSCWVAGDKKAYAPKIAALLGVPEGHRLVSLLPLGYAANANEKPTAKRPLAEVLHWEKF